MPADPSTDRASAPVAPGTVQLAGGCAIVLGVACGTMGGYANVAQILRADLPSLGQLRPGDQIRLRLVPLTAARAIEQSDREQRGARLEVLRTAACDRLWTGDG